MNTFGGEKLDERITDRPVGGEMVGVREIRKVPVVPVSLITAAIMTIWTLILGILGLILGAAVLTQVPLPVSGGEAATGGIISLIISLIVTFIVTFIFTAITAAIYNLLSPRIGGIKIDLW